MVIIVAAIPFVQITQDKSHAEYIQKIEFNNAHCEVCEEGTILSRLGINTDITKADAGEVITYLMKKTSDEHSEYVAATDTTNIILYSYADAPCEAVYVICDNGKFNAVVFCNYVLPDTESIPLGRLYNLYGIKSSSDIVSISAVDDWFKKNIVGAILNKSNAIVDFHSTSLVLQDYSNDAYHKMNYGNIAAKEELLQAYEQTDDNKITFMLETVDGLRFCLEYDAEGG